MICDQTRVCLLFFVRVVGVCERKKESVCGAGAAQMKKNSVRARGAGDAGDMMPPHARARACTLFFSPRTLCWPWKQRGGERISERERDKGGRARKNDANTPPFCSLHAH